MLDQDCRLITDRVMQATAAAGMQTFRSFDLDAARSSGQGFCCPIHGESACSCQLVILLILGREQGPLTIILEGRDAQTWIYLDSGPGDPEEQVDPALTGALLHALLPERTASS